MDKDRKNKSSRLISVLISSYNHEKYIEECIRSIWEQTHKNVEILIIDDNSQDNTYEILKKLEKISPIKMKVFKNTKNLGISKNLNKLINLAKGDIISFMASDDKYYRKETFSENLSKLIENPKIQAIYTEGYVWNGKEFLSKAQGEKEVSYIRAKKYKELLDYMLSNVPHLLIQGSFFRKSLLESIKGFDEKLKADDWVLNIKIFRYVIDKNLEILYNDNICFLYRHHETNTTKDIDKLYNIIKEVIIVYTPQDKKKCLLARLNWRHGKRLLKFRKSFLGFRYMFDGFVSCPSYIYKDIINSIRNISYRYFRKMNKNLKLKLKLKQ